MSEAVIKRVKKVGREVCFLKTDNENPRNGEGAFIRLADGGILHVYTAYRGGNADDHSSASLWGMISRDEGESFGEPFRVIDCPENSENLMSVSLLRMQNGDIGVFYLEKYKKDGYVLDRYMLSRSEDEGKTFLPPTPCIEENDYYVVNNDRVVRLFDGSIVIPAALHSVYSHDRPGSPEGKGRVRFYLSEDDGKSFHMVGKELISPHLEISVGLQEPGVYQCEDGTLWAWFRTNLGYQYEAFSSDRAQSFSEIRPNLTFSSPRSPMQVKNVGKYTVAIYNPIPAHAANPLPFGLDRTPFMLAVSENGAKSFPRFYLLEDDLESSYCYPAIFEGDGYFLVSYYHSNNTRQFLNCTKIVKVSIDEISE